MKSQQAFIEFKWPGYLPGAILVFAIACAGPKDSSPRCVDFEARADSVEGALSIGVNTGADFESIESESQVELELGTQGGWMVRPTLRIDAESLSVDAQSCIWVSIEAQVEGMSQPISFLDAPSFAFEASMGYSEPLNVLLSFDLAALEGRAATLDVSVEGPSAAARTAVDVKLINGE